MAIKVASLNAELRFSRADDRLQRRGTPKKLLEHIKLLDPQVMALLEFSNGDVADGVDDALKEMGYAWEDTAYNDINRKGEWDDMEATGKMPHMRVLSRLAIVSSEKPRFGDIRAMLAVTVVDPDTKQPVEIVSTHLHDQTKELRQAQIADVVSFINRNQLPKMMVGDFNTLHDDDPGVPARMLGSKAIEWIARHFPSQFPLNETAHAHDDLRGFLLRAIDMTKGDVLFPLEEQTDLCELDVAYRPTTTPKLRGHEWLPSIRLLQIDHMFASESIQATPIIISPDLGSDHRALSTTITVG